MKVRLNEPTFGEEEISAAVDVMRSTYVTQGKRVQEFEQAFCDKFGFKYAVACNSGSSANLLAVTALCIKEDLQVGDEIIVPALSWPTTIWPIVQNGLVPVFADCHPETFNMISEGMSDLTRAFMPVHVYGNPCKFDSYGYPVVEDCCEAMGAPVGGQLGTFSFYYSHHITTFEGGMVGCNDIWMADRLRILRSHGWTRDCEDKDAFALENPDIDPRFLFVDQGYNLRMTEVQAAIGICQLPKLDEIVAKRRANHKAYVEALSKYDFFRFQKMSPESSCFSFAIVLKDAPFSCSEIKEHLDNSGIETRPIIAGNMALQPAMKKYDHLVAGSLPNATNIMKNGLAIGNHQDIGPEHISYVAERIEEFVCAL